MPAPDLFGPLDSVKRLTAPAGFAAAHVDGFSWVKLGLDDTDTTKLTPDDWNRIIAQFRALLIDSGLNLAALDPASVYLLRDVLAAKIVALGPTVITANAAAIATALAGVSAFVAAVVAAVPANLNASNLVSGTVPDARLSFTVSTFIRTLLDDIDAATARGTISVYSQAEVNALVAGVGKRTRVRAASTAPLTLSAPGATIDGAAMVAGNIFLAKNQTPGSGNGVYQWNGASVAATRVSEYDTYDEHTGSLISVAEGTANADTLWLCTSNDGGTLGTTAITFSQVLLVAPATATVSGIVELATDAEAIAGADATRAVTPANLPAAVPAIIAALPYGAVGSYVWGYVLNTGVVEGSTYAGSAIEPAGMAFSSPTTDVGDDTADTTNNTILVKGGNPLSGTWMAAGRSNTSTGSVRRRATLFGRIS